MLKGKRAGVILTGGNIDAERYAVWCSTGGTPKTGRSKGDDHYQPFRRLS